MTRPQTIRGFTRLLAMLAVMLSCACSGADAPPVPTVAQVDLPRFMGNWYVIANVPTRYEKGGWNAVETYRLQADGSIDTRFRMNSDARNGPEKHLHSTAFVQAGTGNAIWGVQYIWPLKAQYKVAYLKADYSQTIVARDKRDYAWIMARTPTISAADYDGLVARLKALGYDVSQVRRVPQQWPDAAACGPSCNSP